VKKKLVLSTVTGKQVHAVLLVAREYKFTEELACKVIAPKNLYEEFLAKDLCA